jgi:hypothetical protein
MERDVAATVGIEQDKVIEIGAAIETRGVAGPRSGLTQAK